MKLRFAQPVLGCRVVVQLAVVGIGRFVRVDVFESAVIAEVYFIVVIARNSTRANCLVGEASVM